MNNQNKLIKRIDEIFSDQDYVKSRITPRVEQALRACRAEIERLETALYIANLVRKYHQKRIAELEKPYVPMSRKEKMELYKHMLRSDSQTAVVDETEATTIKRYNEQRSVK